VCAQSAFGLLCPEAKRDALDAAINEAREVVERFNESASVTRVAFNVLCGRIAPDDAEAIRAINAEMSDLMATMAEGMRNLDVKVIRDAANRARSVGQMLTPEMQEKVQAAIDIARKTARDAVKAAETGAQEIDRAAITKIMDSRTAFLDLDEQKTIGEVEHAGRAVDFEREDDTPERAQARINEMFGRRTIETDEPNDTQAAPPAQGRMFEV
jgi:hypothetical protein